MIITLKYNPGDTVWYLSSEQKICSAPVKCISGINHDVDSKAPIELRLEWELDAEEVRDRYTSRVRRTEDKLFTSRDELIASL